jgi:hypothetical protein
MITPSAVMLDKELFDRAGGFNESLRACEDYDLWLRITCAHPVGLVNRHLVTRFGGHEDQLSATVPALDRFRVRALIDLVTGKRLSTRQLKQARAMLAKKARILANGFRKRGVQHAYEQYAAIATWAQGNEATPAPHAAGPLHRIAAEQSDHSRTPV